MRIKIKRTQNTEDFNDIYPNIIYNRYDLFCEEEAYRAVRIYSAAGEKILEYRLLQDKIELGVWRMAITNEEMECLLCYIHNEHPNVKKVTYLNGLIPYGKSKEHNYFRIVFPKSVEEMKARVTPKSWSKMRRRNRRAEEIYGPMELEEYENGNIPEEVVETFFRYKLATRNRRYDMTAKEYLQRYHVSDCYVVKFGNRIGAMHFCCEQCPVVYGENHSYDPELKEYSLGKFIFAYSLLRMVEKGHTEIDLAGGDFEYKTHYGSIEETLYDCQIDMQELFPTREQLRRQRKAERQRKWIEWKRSVKRFLPKKLLGLLWHLKMCLKKKR